MLIGSGFQRRTFSILLIPEMFLATATNFSQQQLTTLEPKRFTSSSVSSTDSIHLTPGLATISHKPTTRLHYTIWRRLFLRNHWRVVLITTRYGPRRKRRWSTAAGQLSLSGQRTKLACLRKLYIVTAVAYSFLALPLPINGSTRYDILWSAWRIWQSQILQNWCTGFGAKRMARLPGFREHGKWTSNLRKSIY
jgi:hypothetical protein